MNKKTIISTASRLFAALTLLLFLSTASMEAQVTIGKLADPHTAAILDLSQKEDAAPDRGLLLPHVKLTGLKPFQLLTSPSLQQEADATGMVVYNEAHVNDDVYPGIYVWDGEKWGRIDDGTLPPPPVMAPLSIDKSGDACGNGVLFSIPDDYPDWSNATNFVWSLTVSPSSYTPVTVTSGSKNSHFFVPYDGTDRTYEVSVYAEGSKQRSITCTGSQKGKITATPNFSINGYNCYDIKKTAYDKDGSSPTTAYGIWESRTALDSPSPDSQFSYSVLGAGTLTYAWTIFDPDTILLNPPVDAISASIDIQFKPWVLEDDWLIAQPIHERIVVLTCVVTEGSCEYVVSKEIRVGDRDCCARLTDADGNIYSAVRFGTAGCWMTENLAVTKNEKRETVLSKGNSSTNNPRYTTPQNNSFTGAQNSDKYGTGIGKPGLLYNWAAAVGAMSAAEATGTNYSDYTAVDIVHPASKATSNKEDICPVGWYLPSDAEWYALESEIHKNRNKYSSVSGIATDTVPIGTSTFYGEQGQYMRAVGDTPMSSNPGNFPGASNPKESGFNGLLTGLANNTNWVNYGSIAYYWNSSSISSTAAWSCYLHWFYPGVSRVSSNNKYLLFSVRCKKLD
jgi:uncharacterized protein (TIGR02145 family)